MNHARILDAYIGRLTISEMEALLRQKKREEAVALNGNNAMQLNANIAMCRLCESITDSSYDFRENGSLDEIIAEEYRRSL